LSIALRRSERKKEKAWTIFWFEGMVKKRSMKLPLIVLILGGGALKEDTVTLRGPKIFLKSSHSENLI